MKRISIAFALALSLAACGAKAPATQEPDTRPAMRWDHRPEALNWTEATIAALQANPAGLHTLTPGDIATYCPGYDTASPTDRAAFWAGLLSALAKHESTWNPQAVGGGGRWFGLVQIDPRTARGYGCAAKSGDALKDGVANLQCAVRIATAQVSKRGTVSRGMLDWGPFHSAGKRADMQTWTRQQSYCQPS
ncbi:transglycosylase SLT domain-containing protein [Oceaniglobus ichthyenteri]|uniref:lytic transglycosylase domain-containing protein n=1 Tax=Oceaniglobus ichthyenteri TaxID=2136177 RepID=UPI000D378CB9|nr:transglycosylase SLT domain-containing protein [Oceaniglobus ichthyenteri]